MPTTRSISSAVSAGNVALHQRHHGRAVLGVGHDAQAHRIDAEIADRRAQALLDRPVAVGRRRVQAGELDLLGMLGGELGIGDAPAHRVDRLGQRLRPRPVLQQPPHRAQGPHDLGLPGIARLQDRAQPVGGQRRPARGAEPATEQQYVHVAAAPLLQVEAGLGHALAGIELEREIPERMGQKIRHLRCFPLAGRRGTRRRARWLEHEQPDRRSRRTPRPSRPSLRP